MSIFTVTPENLSKLLHSGMKEFLKSHLRHRVNELVKTEIENIIEEVCKEAVTHVSSYRELSENNIKLIVSIDGVKRDVKVDTK